MRVFLTILLLGLIPSVFAQTDTLRANRFQIADTMYGQLTQHVNTGFLSNRAHAETGITAIHQGCDTVTSSADLFYGLIYELKLMALDTSVIPTQTAVYSNANGFVAEYEFEEDRYVYPLGIADYRYNALDVDYGIANGLLAKSLHTYSDISSSNAAYSEDTVRLIAPLFDYFNSLDLSVVFRQEDFRSNYRDVSEIASLEIKQNGGYTTVNFGQEYQLTLQDSIMQYFSVRLTYTDGSIIENDIIVNTPEAPDEIARPKSSLSCSKGEIVHADNLKLQFCLVRACAVDRPVERPFLLVTGYRPPIFGQSFEKTWQFYNDEHEGMLQNFVNQGYDVFIVRFNMHNHPQSMGLNQAADLFVDFMNQLNAAKQNDFENVISASSMSSDIVRLALLKMERYHDIDPNYPHHHTRLFAHYDANLYGANLPYTALLQIYSGFLSQSLFTMETEVAFLKTFLFATMEQKATKELLIYHPGESIDVNEFAAPIMVKTVIPTHHTLRQNFYNLLDDFDNGLHFTPLPRSPRHISISLGKIRDQNHVTPNDSRFKSDGILWVSSLDHILRVSKFNTSPELLFKRYELSSFLMPANHNVYVKNMLPIDNASGSYLAGMGNILTVAMFTYRHELFGTLPDPHALLNANNAANPLFSHKSVATALALNPALWLGNNTATADMQALDLMFYDLSLGLGQSNHYGYPNLGRPNDHFNITPFEAIYADNEVDPHIRLEGSLHTTKLVEFFYSEVEPSWLWLQNQNVGGQANPLSTYRMKRQALEGLVTGYLVTPQTDPGNYVIESNAVATLQAGKLVDLFPGTDFQEGANVTVIINYEDCYNGKSMEANNGPDEVIANDAIEHLGHESKDEEEQVTIRLVPNPTDGQFSVVSIGTSPIEIVTVYDNSGKLVFTEKDLHVARYQLPRPLQKGTYIVNATVAGQLQRKKLIVL